MPLGIDVGFAVARDVLAEQADELLVRLAHEALLERARRVRDDRERERARRVELEEARQRDHRRERAGLAAEVAAHVGARRKRLRSVPSVPAIESESCHALRQRRVGAAAAKPAAARTILTSSGGVMRVRYERPEPVSIDDRVLAELRVALQPRRTSRRPRPPSTASCGGESAAAVMITRSASQLMLHLLTWRTMSLELSRVVARELDRQARRADRSRR